MALLKPVLIFIPGAWHTPEYFSDVIEKLESHAYECHALWLPSVGGDDTTTVADDAAFVQKTTLPLIEEGKKVVLVMHSYGGIPGTESVKGLAQKDREATGKKGGVVGLVYLASFLIPEQDSISTFSRSMPDWTILQGNRLFLKRTSEIMYNDIPIEISEKYTKKTQYQAASSFATPLTYPAYRHVSTAYLLCKQDRAIPLEMQQAMVRLAGEGATAYLCDSGHSPMLRMPAGVVNIIRKTAGEAIDLAHLMPDEPHMSFGQPASSMVKHQL